MTIKLITLSRLALEEVGVGGGGELNNSIIQKHVPKQEKKKISIYTCIYILTLFPLAKTYMQNLKRY